MVVAVWCVLLWLCGMVVWCGGAACVMAVSWRRGGNCRAVVQVESVQAFGQTLAVFRGRGGEAHVTDAYCPHIGANMAVGGVVKGDCLECPFHGWRFRGSDGKCEDIPYSSKGESRRWPQGQTKHWLARRRL